MNKIEIRTEDGVCPAYEAGTGPRVLMFMDGIGMRPAIVAMGERLAAAGYHVLVPDLFYRVGPYTPVDPAKLFTDPALREEWRTKFFSTVNVANIMRDTRAFLDHLPGKVGVTGYCMGGKMALSAAIHFPDRIVAAAAFHPGSLANDAPDSPHRFADKIRAKVHVACAQEDPSFPDDQKQQLEAALTAAKVDHVVETWPYKHGWVPTDTPVYDAAGAERHWGTLTKLLASVR